MPNQLNNNHIQYYKVFQKHCVFFLIIFNVLVQPLHLSLWTAICGHLEAVVGKKTSGTPCRWLTLQLSVRSTQYSR